MSGIAQGFPSINAPLVDQQGYIRQTWLQLLVALWNRTGSGGGTSPADLVGLLTLEGGASQEEELAGLLGDSAPQGASEEPAALGELFAQIPVEVLDDLSALFALAPNDNADDVVEWAQTQSVEEDLAGLLALVEVSLQTPGQPEGLTVGASPYTYEPAVTGNAVVQGGTVTKIEFSRDGGATLVDCGVVAGIVPLLAADQVIVTYAVAPTMTFIPMGV